PAAPRPPHASASPPSPAGPAARPRARAPRGRARRRRRVGRLRVAQGEDLADAGNAFETGEVLLDLSMGTNANGASRHRRAAASCGAAINASTEIASFSTKRNAP